MQLHVLARSLTALAICIIATAEEAQCQPGYVQMDVTTAADLALFTVAVSCTGEGYFDINWNGSVKIEQTIDISNRKTVAISGSNGLASSSEVDGKWPTGAVINGGQNAGIFNVSNESILILHNLVLEEGYSEAGGAVSACASSSLHVFSCTFRNNIAIDGGKSAFG